MRRTAGGIPFRKSSDNLVVGNESITPCFLHFCGRLRRRPRYQEPDDLLAALRSCMESQSFLRLLVVLHVASRVFRLKYTEPSQAERSTKEGMPAFYHDTSAVEP
uniref:Uncharacterized protein n=1 Tax=Grammatophora oceanica TaxID=210454 RepID=A0A7S1UU98_9STRA